MTSTNGTFFPSKFFRNDTMQLYPTELTSRMSKVWLYGHYKGH